MLTFGLDGYSPLWLATMALALVSTGVVAGVLAGMLGVGGGIVIVPVLYHVFTLMGVDEDSVVPDPSLSIRGGAIAPWPASSRSQ